MTNFGASLRLMRVGAGTGLRELAQRIGVSASYLSRVEHGHDPTPTPDRLVAIARALEIPPEVLLELADQITPAVSSYVGRVPAAGALFLEIAQRDLSAPEIGRIMAYLDREFPQGRTNARRQRLPDLLAKERIVPCLKCSDLEELLSLAVSRLPLRSSPGGRVLAEKIWAREREAPSTLGFAFYVPHLIVRGAVPAAVLLTLSNALDIPTPDGKPVTLALLVLSNDSGRAHLDLLAQAVRLARQGTAEQLRGIESPARILAKFRMLAAR